VAHTDSYQARDRASVQSIASRSIPGSLFTKRKTYNSYKLQGFGGAAIALSPSHRAIEDVTPSTAYPFRRPDTSRVARARGIRPDTLKWWQWRLAPPRYIQLVIRRGEFLRVDESELQDADTSSVTISCDDPIESHPVVIASLRERMA
jgi:hypothetical protein